MTDTCRITVNVAQGAVCGVIDTLPNGQPFHYFKGIPYAEPPVGELRFEAPVPLKTFKTAVIDCSKEGNRCLQKYPAKNQATGFEDCLFLNVYTPAIEGPVPVMVWIHGGGFNTGFGDSNSPEYLIQENVIVVTINYRLGPLGFLYLPEAGIEGNAALKDQLLALKWVNQNISRFGGDPNNVTLFGQSAGAACVHAHILSENSKPYFHKAICQSGTMLMEWARQYLPKEKARKFLELCDYSGKSDHEIKDFLKQLPLETLTEALIRQYEVLSDEEIRRGLPLPFKIVVESKDNPNAILTEEPLVAMRTANKIDIPIMAGITDCDGMFMLMGRIFDLETIDQDISRMILKAVNLSPFSHASKMAGKELKKFYFGDQKLSRETIPEFIKLLTDYFFNVCLHLSYEMHGKYQSSSPFYCYRFCFDGALNLMKKSLRFSKFEGACHADENSYLFLTKGHEECQLSERDIQMRTTICRLWTNFAKYSNPNPPTDLSLPFTWSPLKPIPKNAIEFDIDCLDINDHTEMIQNPDKERIDFWRHVFKKWNGGLLKAKL